MSSPERTPRRARASLVALSLAAALAACAAPARDDSPTRAFAPPDPSAVGLLALGRVPTDTEIRGWDIDIAPDGRNLPPGSGTVAQGRAIYAQQCVACHGENGKGGLMRAPLAGGGATLKSNTPVMTVGGYWPHATTLFDYIRRAMPFDRPQSLKPDQVYALTAYLLHLDGVVGADATLDARTVTATKMPNRSAFFTHDNAPDTRAERCMSNCRPVK
jgi:S-disulfanyl-L-cysteine oxidoreductase SoxD